MENNEQENNHLNSISSFDKSENSLLDAEMARLDEIDEEREALKKKGLNDIIFGALWCGGGIALTMAEIGYIFYGAIIVGAIQLIRGLINYSS